MSVPEIDRLFKRAANILTLTSLAGQLVKNGLYFKSLKRSGRAARPTAVSLEITHHCLARCTMCNIWKIPRHVPDMSIDQWLMLVSSPLFSNLKELDITGGEPFLVKNLPDLFYGICDLKRQRILDLCSIAITTNGLLTKKVIADTEKIAEMLLAKGIELVVVCALDAVSPLHDRIRNYKNAWFRVNNTIQGLKSLGEKYPNLILGLKTTILPINVDELEKIVEYAEDNNLFTIISPCIITKGRYLNLELADELTFNQEDKNKMIHFYEKKLSHWTYHADQMKLFLRTGEIRKPCSCGFNYFFIRSNGDLFLCPLVDKPLGNVQNTRIEDLIYSDNAARIRRQIGKFPECSQCTEPGLERYSLPFEGFTYLALLLKMEKEKFIQMHHHMGLDKYFLHFKH